jgi:Lrp/AsnC ligand binding domain
VVLEGRVGNPPDGPGRPAGLRDDRPADGGAVVTEAVEALVRVRLSTAATPGTFETWVLARPATRVLWALTGDDDYELWLSCPDLAGLNDELALLRRAGGAERTSTSLLLRELLAHPASEEPSHVADPRRKPARLDGLAGHGARHGLR